MTYLLRLLFTVRLTMQKECFRPITWMVFITVTPAVLAQSVSLQGTRSAVNVGAVNVCKANHTTPAPCNKIETFTYKVTSSGTLGVPRVLTLGVPDKDFTLANGSTCTGSLSQGSTCTVIVDFRPAYAGGRSGAVQVTDASGNVLATTPIWGTGNGPEIQSFSQGAFGPIITVSAPQGDINYDILGGLQLAVDGGGNVYMATDHTDGGGVYEVLADGSGQIVLPFDFSAYGGPSGGNYVAGLAIDGAGDVFVTALSASGPGVVLELPSGSSTQTIVPFAGLVNPVALAIDGLGEVIVADNGPSTSRLLKLPSAYQSGECCQTEIDLPGPVHSMTADAAGNLFLYLGENGGNYLAELPVGGGPLVTRSAGPSSVGGDLSGLAVDPAGDLFTLTSIETGWDDEYTYANVGGQIFAPSGNSSRVLPAFENIIIGYYSWNSAVVTNDTYGNLYYSYSNGGFDAFRQYNPSSFAPLDFGTVTVGAAKTISLPVTNGGNEPLIFSTAYVSPSFHLKESKPSNCETNVAPGHTCTLEVEFAPATIGRHSVELTLKTNTLSNVVVPLKGVGSH